MDLKDRWNQFASAGASLFTFIATFLIAPPMLKLDQDLRIDWFIKFLIACLLALFTVPMLRKSHKSDYIFWYRTAVIALATGLVLVFSYINLAIDWSVPYYEGRTIVVGEAMTKEAELQKQRVAKDLNRPFISDETFVKARRGETHLIWDTVELKRRFLLLNVAYILNFIAFAIFIISVIQSIYCYERET